MSISAPFIRRPVATTLMMLALLAAGLVGLRTLPVSDLPNVEFPTIQVTAALPGANPETMAAAIATPLERQFATIAGVDSMTSTSTLGATQITLQFVLDRKIDAAALDVQSMIARASPLLPRDLPTPPTFQKVNPADAPVLYIALSSSTIPLSTLNELADTTIAQRISMVAGVAQVQVFGSQKYAVRIQLDPRELANRSLGIDEVTTAVQQANVNLPTGVLKGDSRALTIRSEGRLQAADEYRPVIVAFQNGAPVHLGDLGRVINGVENDQVASWLNGTRAIVLAVLKQPGTNTVDVVDGIQRLLPRFRSQVPAGAELTILYDRSVSIRGGVHDVELTLLLAIGFVVLVIFSFLRSARATLLPSIAVPLSLVGTFAIMALLGFSLNNLTLLALTLSVGFVVDDAIVVLENVVRHIEHGEKPSDAALSGASEIGFTIVSMTLSLVAVFIPVLFMGGILGRLLREFAVTIAVAILLSGVVSLTLTPMLASRFLRPARSGPRGRLFQVSERFFSAMAGGYERSLGFVMRHRLATLIVAALTLVATGWLAVTAPKGFLPSEDTGQFFASTEAPEGTSFDAMVRYQQTLAAVIGADPAVGSFMSSVGGAIGGGTTNTGRIFVRLKPSSQRPDVDTVIARVRASSSGVPNLRVYLQNPPPIRIGGQLTKSQYQFALQGSDTAELYATASTLEQRLRSEPALLDVTTDLQIKNPELRVSIERDRASALGLSAQAIQDALFSSFAARTISTILAETNQYYVLLELEPRYQRDPSSLDLLYLRSSNDQIVPISAVTRQELGTGPLSVNHVGQLPAVTVSFNLAPGVSLGDAVARVGAVARQVVPSSISTSFQGTAQAFQASTAGLGWLLVLAIVVIYVVLGILYESFFHPITILSGLPAAGFGALLSLRLFGMELDLYGFVGIILLIGIVKKNAIMMIDFAVDAERRGASPHDAIVEGSLVRFRPIMMTTLAALMGTLPIAIGVGASAGSRRSLGVAVVGGLLFSQLLTLYLTPVVYTYLDRLQVRLGRRTSRSA